MGGINTILPLPGNPSWSKSDTAELSVEVDRDVPETRVLSESLSRSSLPPSVDNCRREDSAAAEDLLLSVLWCLEDPPLMSVLRCFLALCSAPP